MDDTDYVLGTHDEEIARLGVQHAVWRSRVLDSWRRAGIASGQRVIDFGAGPGFAALDLADVVGGSGEVLALDRSARFLDHLRAAATTRGLTNITPIVADLSADPLPVKNADAAWCRWIFAFLCEPRAALERLIGGLKPGGCIVIHEYADYGVWRMAPRIASFEAFVDAVMESWRADGGEPDIGLDLPGWLERAGCRIETLNPIVDVIDQTSPIWRWPSAFFDVNLNRLVELGRLSSTQAQEMRADFTAASADPSARMVTPVVLEITARRPG